MCYRCNRVPACYALRNKHHIYRTRAQNHRSQNDDCRSILAPPYTRPLVSIWWRALLTLDSSDMEQEPAADAAAGPGPGSTAAGQESHQQQQERVVKRYRRTELDDEEDKHNEFMAAVEEEDGDG